MRAHEDLEFHYRTLKHAQARDDGSFLARMFITNVHRRIKELEKYGKHKLHAQMGDANYRPGKKGNADLYRGTWNFLRRCRESLYQSFQRRRLGSEQNFVDCKR